MTKQHLRDLSLLVIFVLTLSSCTTTDHQSVVHIQNWPSQTPRPQEQPRQLIVFMDGTGNDVRDRTNVRRLFEMTVSRHRPEVIAYYDPGVGTGKRPINRLFGRSFGYGFQSNLREALTFLTENYREHDEISIFGFSRGAYNAAVLTSVISGAGLPRLRGKAGESVSGRHERAVDAVRKYFGEVRSAESQAEDYANAKQNESLPPEERARLWREHYWQKLTQTSEWSAKEHRIRPDIAVLGLWEPVNSLIGGSLESFYYGLGKVAWSVSDVSEFDRHKGHKYHPYALGQKVKKCLIAVSLDEERQPFALELPDSALGKPEAYEFVWFVGDHSDAGGGHRGDKDLAGISMNWMLAHVGDRLLGPGGSRIRVHEDYSGARHDLFLEKSWKQLAYRVRGEVLGKRARRIKPLPERRHPLIWKADADHLVPMRYEGWTMKIHRSVLKRMFSGQDRFYAPHDEAHIVDLAKGALAKPFERNPKGGYCPRPFRQLPAVGASDESWAQHEWTAESIRSCYAIVDTPLPQDNSKAANRKLAGVLAPDEDCRDKLGSRP